MMQALLLISALAASAPPITVVVLSKHRPTDLRLQGAACTAASKTTDQVRLKGGVVELCLGSRCRTAGASVNIRCKAAPKVVIPGVPPRRYGRAFLIRADKGALRVLATVSEDTYVAGVARSELSGAPPEALRAQTVLARTYVRHARQSPRHEDATVCDLTHCQVFREARQPSLREPRVLLDPRGEVSPVFFHSTCGGYTLDAQSVWPGATDLSNLVGGPDTDRATDRAWCAGSPHHRWITEVGEARLAEALQPLVHRALEPSSLELTALDAGGLQWRIEDQAGPHQVSGRELHRRLGRALGWSKVKSSRFSATRAGRTFVLRGEGLGHGVGLCQTGAMARAKAGQSAETILKAYFPKLRLSP